MAGCTDSCCPVHGQADVSVTRHARFARVDPDSHPHLGVFGPGVARDRALRIDGGGDSLLRPAEGDEEGVSLGVDLVAARILEGAPKQALVVGHRLCVAVPEQTEELGRPLDIGEQEGDGAARELRHQSAFTGKRARTSKPPPGRGPASSEPPTTETRSRIPTSP